MRHDHRIHLVFIMVCSVLLCLPQFVKAESSLNIREKRLDHPADHATGEILVSFKEGVSESTKAAVHARHGGKRTRVGYGRAFDVVGSPGKTDEALIESYESDPNVSYAEPNYKIHAHLEPNDQYFGFQWHMPQVKAQAAWDISTGLGVIVAVIDTGVRISGAADGFLHPLVAGYDFVNNDTDADDDNAHGTHVAKTIAEVTNNGIGVTGLAFNSRIMPIKVLGADGSGTTEWVANGIRFAADNGADVANLSLGRSPQFGPSQTEQAAVQYAVNSGVTVVVSSGNDFSRSGVGYPARYEEAIAVGAANAIKKVPRYSNRGEGIDITAPGGDDRDRNRDGFIDGVLQETFDPSDNSWAYWFYIGTSQAAPHVSGAAAMVIANGTGSGLTGAARVAAVRGALESSAEDLGDPGYDLTYGWGHLDIEAALNSTPPQPDNTPPIISNVAATNLTNSSATITWNTDEPANSQVDFGTNTNYGSTVAEGALVSSHSLLLTGLATSTVYNYQASSADSSNNSASSGNFTFETTAAGASDVVTITKAEYRVRNGQLKVEAASSSGGNVTLTVSSPSTGTNYGQMSYDSNKNLFKLTGTQVANPGAEISVISSGGGSDTTTVSIR